MPSEWRSAIPESLRREAGLFLLDCELFPYRIDVVKELFEGVEERISFVVAGFL
jgi:hypothetical protein